MRVAECMVAARECRFPPTAPPNLQLTISWPEYIVHTNQNTRFGWTPYPRQQETSAGKKDTKPKAGARKRGGGSRPSLRSITYIELSSYRFQASLKADEGAESGSGLVGELAEDYAGLEEVVFGGFVVAGFYCFFAL